MNNKSTQKYIYEIIDSLKHILASNNCQIESLEPDVLIVTANEYKFHLMRADTAIAPTALSYFEVTQNGQMKLLLNNIFVSKMDKEHRVDYFAIKGTDGLFTLAQKRYKR